jgi:hypothetical protein
MPRPPRAADARLPRSFTPTRQDPRDLTCAQCAQQLECVEQNKRAGAWIGLLLCPNCRSEYFYAYRSGQLLRRS